jgi:sugar porter (SP) family MFS transporter
MYNRPVKSILGESSEARLTRAESMPTLTPPDSSRKGAYAYWLSLTAALSGLLFGFDTAVINGAVVFLRREFGLSEVGTGAAVSSLLVGCVIGAGAGGTLSDRLGRKKVLLASSVLFTLSTIGAAIPSTFLEFLLARFVQGVAIGVASVTAPLYIAEVSPARIRGRLITFQQLAIVVGILCAYVVNWALAGIGQANWRWMIASAVLPSFIFLLCLLWVPESPRWLVRHGRTEEAFATIVKLEGSQAAESTMKEITASILDEAGSFRELLSPRFRRSLLIAATLAILTQATGINTIIYYGSVILTEQVSSQDTTGALLANVTIGVINLFGTIAALFILDKVGRKPPLMISAAGTAASMAALAIAMSAAPSRRILVILPILTYIGFFAVGLGVGAWVLMSELFPTRVRGRAMSVATVSLWVTCLIVSFTFLPLVSWISAPGAFVLYSLLCTITLIFIWRFLPETKGKTLEEIEKQWSREVELVKQGTV